jgi:type IV pilus modification protein PilV
MMKTNRITRVAPHSLLSSVFRHLSSRKKGFSLIEIVIALAVISIGLIAVVGLIPQGLQASRDAADNTLAATIVQDMFNGLRAGPYNNALVSYTPTAQYQDLRSLPLSGLVFSNAYDQAGFTTNTWAGAFYKLVLLYQPQSPALTVVTATMVWPAQSTSPVSTNVFVTTIANYQQ